ncbi:microfibril-associated glycoprotein 4-like [Anopheles maculipalpis]|uniref:microfibril-associated glycoprotein 4-like n=1 Tax=Anopheles maculipalpis TaxID=1496333 RepID=UPI002159A110|nr:microfibril-associated glycoprotein 4-like [Anopheles maculipalpis]
MMTLIVSLLFVSLCTRLCEGSFSLLSEPRQTCAGYAGIADAIAALTKTISNQTPVDDPLLGLQSSLQQLLQQVTVYQSCDDVTGPSGLYRIRDGNDVPTHYFCQTDLLGGGWTVIQRRTNGKANFTRSFNEYRNGFGHPDQEFWIGLTRLTRITTPTQYELAIVMDAFDGDSAVVRYSSFKVSDETDGFRLATLSGFSVQSGNIGNSMSNLVGKTFSTFDRDTDSSTTVNCANVWKGGWWSSDCGESNLNGFYNGANPTDTPKTSMVWTSFKGLVQSLKSSVMLIRKKRA